MDDIGSLPAIDPGNSSTNVQNSSSGLSPPRLNVDRTQPEACIGDAFAMPVDARGHDDVVACFARGNREFETVRDEIPILGDEEQQLAAARRLGVHGRRCCDRRGRSQDARWLLNMVFPAQVLSQQLHATR